MGKLFGTVFSVMVATVFLLVGVVTAVAAVSGFLSLGQSQNPSDVILCTGLAVVSAVCLAAAWLGVLLTDVRATLIASHERDESDG